jgi:hypothetical protein
MKLLPLYAVLVLALAACSKPAPTTDAAAPAATVSQAPAEDADVELTMDKVEAWIAASKNLAAAEQADASLDSAMNASEEDGVQYAARLESTPKLRAAIEQAGMSARDYALVSESLVASLMAVGAVEAGALKEIPEGMNPKHIEFVRAHRAEIETMMQQAQGG